VNPSEIQVCKIAEEHAGAAARSLTTAAMTARALTSFPLCRSKGRRKPRALRPRWRGFAAELAASRERITELETRIDVDPLTETLNRRGFERELKRLLAYVKRYGVSAALIYLDLDGFKR